LERWDGGAQDVDAHLDLGEDFCGNVVEEDRFAVERVVEADETQDGDGDEAGSVVCKQLPGEMDLFESCVNGCMLTSDGWRTKRRS
jgi:hypothetical protein